MFTPELCHRREGGDAYASLRRPRRDFPQPGRERKRIGELMDEGSSECLVNLRVEFGHSTDTFKRLLNLAA